MDAEPAGGEQQQQQQLKVAVDTRPFWMRLQDPSSADFDKRNLQQTSLSCSGSNREVVASSKGRT